MNVSTRRLYIDRFRRLYLPTFLNLVATSVWFLANSGSARADGPDRVRVMTSSKKFAGTELVAAAYTRDAPRWMHAHHIEWSVGVLHRTNDVRPFVSVGPVWRLRRPRSPLFVEFSFSPTVLGGSGLGDRDLGGNVHFTSAVSVGRRFTGGWSVIARAQHLSNGGLNARNPGLDMVGLSVAKTFE